MDIQPYLIDLITVEPRGLIYRAFMTRFGVVNFFDDRLAYLVVRIDWYRLSSKGSLCVPICQAVPTDRATERCPRRPQTGRFERLS